MTPLKLKELLLDSQAVSLADITNTFNISMELAMDLLQFWIKRGCCVQVQSCESCQLCDHKTYYQWKMACVKSS